MGDGKVNKYAIVINARSDVKGAEQARAAVQDLRKKGYVTFAAGDKKYPVWADMYVSNPKTLKNMIDGIKAVIDDDDQVVIRVVRDTAKADATAGTSKFVSKDIMEQLDALRRLNGLFTRDNYLACYNSYTYYDVTSEDKRAGAYWCIKAAKKFRFDRNATFNTCWYTFREGFSYPEATKRCVNLISSGRFVFSDDPKTKVGSK